jgi:hypothetical protein
MTKQAAALFQDGRQPTENVNPRGLGREMDGTRRYPLQNHLRFLLHFLLEDWWRASSNDANLPTAEQLFAAQTHWTSGISFFPMKLGP